MISAPGAGASGIALATPAAVSAPTRKAAAINLFMNFFLESNE
jgi:hypothetical protein